MEATFDPGATEDQIREMVQSLLVERFRIRSHRVTTEADGYALTIGKSGLKVREAEDSGVAEGYVAGTLSAPGVITIEGKNASISQLAEALQRSQKTPFWDRTGVGGKFSFTFRFTDGTTPDAVTDAPSLGTALQETLGIRMEKQKGPVETLVIDDLAAPSDN